MTLSTQRSTAVEHRDRLEAEILPLLQIQRRRLKGLTMALRKWLGQRLISPKRAPRDRRNIRRLYFGWFGGVQCFYSRESEP